MNKKIAIALILVLFAFSAADLIAREEEKIKKEITYKVEKNARLQIENISGWTKIESWDKNEILIKYTIIAYGHDSEDAEKTLKRTMVISNKSGNQVDVKVKYEKSGFLSSNKYSGDVNFDIKVPIDCRIDSSNVSGDVKISNLKADIDTSTVSGDNIVQSSYGKLDIATVSGNISLTDHKGNIEASCVSGDALLSNIVGSMKAESVSGNVILKNAKLSNLTAETVSGDVVFSGEFSEKAEVSMATVSGDVAINIQGDFGIEYNFSSFSGDISINLPNKEITKSKNLRGSYEAAGKSKISINAETLSGDIKLLVK
jgi:DUF4097 and DUF4098 domain-containing protein YvlB